MPSKPIFPAMSDSNNDYVIFLLPVAHDIITTTKGDYKFPEWQCFFDVFSHFRIFPQNLRCLLDSICRTLGSDRIFFFYKPS